MGSLIIVDIDPPKLVVQHGIADEGLRMCQNSVFIASTPLKIYITHGYNF